MLKLIFYPKNIHLFYQKTLIFACLSPYPCREPERFSGETAETPGTDIAIVILSPAFALPTILVFLLTWFQRVSYDASGFEEKIKKNLLG
jgi:hypothetical protein